MSTPRPARPRLLPASVIDTSAAAPQPTEDGHVLERLREALTTLPPAERTAAMVAFGLDEGPIGVAMELEMSERDADALVRSALQLLRGQLADADVDEGEVYARLRRRRRHGNQRPGDRLDGR